MMKQFDIAATRHVPVIEILPALLDVWPTNPAESTKRGLETQQHRWHAVRVGLIHPRLRLTRPSSLSRDGVGPALAVEEPSRPRQLVSIHDPIETTSARRCEGLACRTFVRQGVARSCDEALI